MSTDLQEKLFRLIWSPPAAVAVLGMAGEKKIDEIRAVAARIASPHDIVEACGSVSDAREVCDFVSSEPICGDARIAIVDGCRGLSDPAQDAYLKICEETPKNASIVIAVNDSGKLRPALASRLEILSMTFEDVGDVGDDMPSMASRGRSEIKDAILSNLKDMEELHSASAALVSDTPLAKTPRTIAEWSKLSNVEKDAAICVLRMSIQAGGKKAWTLSRFVETISSIPSVSAELHWWRACL